MPLRRPTPPQSRDTHAVTPEDFTPFDAPPTDQVLQAETWEPEVDSLPVRLVEAAQVEQQPTELGVTKALALSATSPEQVLPENKRRATVTFWVAVGESVRVARTEREASRDDSSLIFVVDQGPVQFRWTDACWAMKRAAGAATDRFVICTEDWAR